MKEEEIRPQYLFDKLLELINEDIDTYFSKASYFYVNCPACNSEGKFLFHKNKFNINECPSCKTIFVNPVPDRESLNKYYTESKSTKFWATTFYKVTEKSRREKLWKPKAKQISNIIQQYANDIKCIVDIGGGYGVFMEEFLKINSLEHIIIEPSFELAEVCRKKGLFVIEKFLEDIVKDDLPEHKKVFVSFELFEHLLDPKLFLSSLYNIMNKNDIFVFTTLSGMGVDIQVLQENSKAISPPMHLNFFNPKSIKILLNKIGFEVLDISTPGKLDVDIIANNINKVKDNFWKNFIEYADKDEKIKMQKFLSDNNFSSHMMIMCKKV